MAVSHPNPLDRFEALVWRLTPLATPRIHRHCARCGDERPFASTDRFRLNASKQRIDAWLIYACTTCASTWNMTVLSRVLQRAIDRDLFERMTRNDPATAHAWAFDRAALARAGARFGSDVPFRVDRLAGDLAAARATHRPARLRIEMPFFCAVRLGRLLARELSLSRARLADHADRGEVATLPASPRPLSRPVRDGMIIELAASVIRSRA